MENLNPTAKADLVTDIYLAKQQRRRLLAISESALKTHGQTDWVDEAWALIRAEDFESAYDVWRGKYDALEDLLGQFSDVVHVIAGGRPRAIAAETERIRQILRNYFRAGFPAKGADVAVLICGD